MILGLAITHVYYGRIKAKLQALFAFSGCARRRSLAAATFMARTYRPPSG